MATSFGSSLSSGTSTSSTGQSRVPTPPPLNLRQSSVISYTCNPLSGNTFTSLESRPFYILIADDQLPVVIQVMCQLTQLYCTPQDIREPSRRNFSFPLTEEVIRLSSSIQELAPARISGFVFLLIDKACEAEKALLQRECTLFTNKACTESALFTPRSPVSVAIIDGSLQNNYDGFEVMRRCQPQLMKEGSFQTYIHPHSVDVGPRKNPIPALEEKEQEHRESLRASFIDPSRILPKLPSEDPALCNLFLRVVSESILLQLAKVPKSTIGPARSTPSTPQQHRHRSRTPVSPVSSAPSSPSTLGTHLSPPSTELLSPLETLPHPHLNPLGTLVSTTVQEDEISTTVSTPPSTDPLGKTNEEELPRFRSTTQFNNSPL